MKSQIPRDLNPYIVNDRARQSGLGLSGNERDKEFYFYALHSKNQISPILTLKQAFCWLLGFEMGWKAAHK